MCGAWPWSSLSGDWWSIRHHCIREVTPGSVISAGIALGSRPTTSTHERLTTSLLWLQVYHQHQTHHLRALCSRDTYPSSAQMSPPTAHNAPNPPSALEGCWIARAYLCVLPPTLPAKPGFPCQAGVCARRGKDPHAHRGCRGRAGWLAGRWTLGWLWYHAVPDPCGGCNVYPWYKHHETWLHVLLPRLTQHVALGKAFATSFFLSPCLSVLSNYAKAFQGRDHFSLGSAQSGWKCS